MKLSIIIPVYRVEHVLDRCIESVRQQSFVDWEMILVDDGSPDKCPKCVTNGQRTTSESRLSIN